MKELFVTVLTLSFVGSAAYALTKLLSALGGGRLSQSWRYHALLAAGALFALPVNKLWRLLPRRSVWIRPIRMAQVLGKAAPPAAGAGPERIAAAAAVLWLTVAVALAIWDLGRFIRCRRAVTRGCTGADGRLSAIAAGEARRLGIRRQVRLLVSPYAQSPILVGFVRPTVILTAREMSDEGLRLILAHELTHFRRRDLWKKLFFTALRCVHWFNPMVYLMSRDFSYRMETACDERVVSAFSCFERKSYGYLLIDCAPNVRHGTAAAFVPFASSRRKLERRISTMLKTNKKGRGILGAVLALVLLAGCLAVSALAADRLTVKDVIGSEEAFIFDMSKAKIVEDYDPEDGSVAVKVYDPETGEELPCQVVFYDFSDCEVIGTCPPITVRTWQTVNGEDLVDALGDAVKTITSDDLSALAAQGEIIAP